MVVVHAVRPKWCVLATSFFLFSPSYGQDAASGDGTQRSNAGRLERVEVSARPDKLAELMRRGPVSRQVVTAEELERYGDASVADALKRVPGLTVSDGSIKIRGLAASYTQILLNGDPAPPGFQLDRLNPSQVERIEILKAPTAEYSTQAIGGTINVVLKQPPRFRQRDVQLRVGYNSERPTAGTNLTWGERIQGGLATSLPLSVFQWRARNGVETRVEESQQPSNLAVGERDSRTRNWGVGLNFSPRASWRTEDEAQWTLHGFVQANRWNFANEGTRRLVLQGSPTLPDDVLADGQSVNFRVGVNWVRQFEGERELELKASFQRRNNQFDNLTLRSDGTNRFVEGDTRGSGGLASLRYSWLGAPGHTWATGGELERSTRREKRRVLESGVPETIGPDQPSSQVLRAAAYLQNEMELSERWAAYFGVRAEGIQTRSLSGAEKTRVHSRMLTPVAHSTYKLDDRGKHRLRASLTSSYKAPDPDALLAQPWISSQFPNLTQTNESLFPDRVGRQDLRPERATGLDFAYEYDVGDGALASVGVFRREVKQLIRTTTTLTSVPWATAPRWVQRPDNVGNAQATGLELELKGRVGVWVPTIVSPKTPWNVQTSLQLYRSSVENVPGPDNRLDTQQPWSVNFSTDYTWVLRPGRAVRLGTTITYTPSFRTQQTVDQAVELGQNRSIDAFVAIPLAHGVNLRLIGQNLWPQPARSRNFRGPQDVQTTVGQFRSWYGITLSARL